MLCPERPALPGAAWCTWGAAPQGAFVPEPGKTVGLAVVVLEVALDVNGVFGGGSFEEIAGRMLAIRACAAAGEFAWRATACNWCGAEGIKLRMCTGCRRGYYCSPRCLKGHCAVDE